VLPEQMAPPLLTDDITGDGLTDTLTEAIVLHPAIVVPVTVYVVEAEGLAVTEDPVDAVSPVDGIQL